MTIIVWKDGVLAADQQITSGGTDKARGSKIYYTHDAIIGWCGGAFAAAAFLRWWKEKSLVNHTFAEAVQYSPEDEANDFECIVITKDKVQLWDGKLCPIDVSNWEHVVLGSGSGVAKGALYMGATSVQAVRAAIRYDAMCGFGVETATRATLEKKLQKKSKRKPKPRKKASK